MKLKMVNDKYNYNNFKSDFDQRYDNEQENYDEKEEGENFDDDVNNDVDEETKGNLFYFFLFKKSLFLIKKKNIYIHLKKILSLKIYLTMHCWTKKK
jgi:hypothetical protein